MADFLVACSGCVLAIVAVGLLRVLHGPARADQMMAAQLLGTGGIAALLLMAGATQLTALVKLLVMMARLGDAPSGSRGWLRIALICGPSVFLFIGLGGLWLGEAFLAYPAAYAKLLILAIEFAALALFSLLLGLFPWHTYLPFPAKTLINPPALETYGRCCGQSWSAAR
jgi:hypothetical protein